MPITYKPEEILQWAARHNAHPVERKPFMPDGEPGQLGFVFGQAPETAEHLQPIPWQRFFAIFHMLGLVLRIDGDRDYELLKLPSESSQERFEGRPMQA